MASRLKERDCRTLTLPPASPAHPLQSCAHCVWRLPLGGRGESEDAGGAGKGWGGGAAARGRRGTAKLRGGKGSPRPQHPLCFCCITLSCKSASHQVKSVVKSVVSSSSNEQQTFMHSGVVVHVAKPLVSNAPAHAGRAGIPKGCRGSSHHTHTGSQGVCGGSVCQRAMLVGGHL